MDTLYTDGSCLKNPGGPGGWAFYLMGRGSNFLCTGSAPSTTNNRMELSAVIYGLEFARAPMARVYSDSKYVIDNYPRLGKWRAKRWDGVANRDLWELLDRMVRAKERVEFVWVRGHAGDRYNTLVDHHARKSAEWCKKNLPI